MAEIITLKGENRIAECQGSKTVLTLDLFILSYDPAIDPTAPIDRNAPLPAADKIVYEDSVTQTGYVNPNQVVYSLFMDSTVGPFQFNRMDLVESATDTNVAIATLSTQNKIADDPGAGIRGQNMTRNFMTVYDGAMIITNVTVEASTWQIDFMARLHASDELERLSSRDTWGRSCFWRDGFLVKKMDNNNKYQLVSGMGYVEGIRISATTEQSITPGTLPTDVWLDVCRRGSLNGVTPEITVVFNGNAQQDYTDSQQVDHYLERIASINSAGTVTDRRTVHPIDNALLNYLVPEAPKDGNQYVRMDGQWVPVDVPINWSAPLATDYQTIINPPYIFTTAEVYINGVMQDQDRGAYIIIENRIELAAPLNKGDAVQVILGSTMPAMRSNFEPGLWQLITTDYVAKNGDHLLLDSTHQTFTVKLPKSPKPGDMIHFLEVGEATEVHKITLDPQGLVIMNDIKMDVTTNKLSFEVLYTEQYGWRLME